MGAAADVQGRDRGALPLLPGVLEAGADEQGIPLVGVKQAMWFDRCATV